MVFQIQCRPWSSKQRQCHQFLKGITQTSATHLSTQLSEYMKDHIYSNYGISTVKKEMGALTTHKVASSQLAWCLSRYFIATVSQRSWVWIPFRPEFFSGFNFTTAMISHVFMTEWYHATHSRHERQALRVRVQPVSCTRPLAFMMFSPNLKYAIDDVFTHWYYKLVTRYWE